MQPSKEILIKLAIEKSQKALKDAELTLNNKSIETALNRTYYAIFYIVTALAHKYNFTTAKHSTLRGWFNKKFVYEDKIFDAKMAKVYKETFIYRQKSDYDITYIPNEESAKDLLCEAKNFVEIVLKVL
ncbi:MAG: HEPN domain-containing protein [Elusimicrobiota bacterium]|jgi:uncharacterized protein (UPF0332 family)|nr:HEPN domain-containing protein [Elusimicrobiota bacterium]